MMNARKGSSVHFSCCSARARNALDNGRTQMALKTGKAGQKLTSRRFATEPGSFVALAIKLSPLLGLDVVVEGFLN
jgi:hypothetical protein